MANDNNNNNNKRWINFQNRKKTLKISLQQNKKLKLNYGQHIQSRGNWENHLFLLWQQQQQKVNLEFKWKREKKQRRLKSFAKKTKGSKFSLRFFPILFFILTRNEQKRVFSGTDRLKTTHQPTNEPTQT